MKIHHLEHNFGGRIESIDAIRHETHKGAASWEFVGHVVFNDAPGKSTECGIAPFQVCYDRHNEASVKERDLVFDALDRYLVKNGTWDDKRRWKPHSKNGQEELKDIGGAEELTQGARP